MSKYIEQCLSDHIENMKCREEAIRIEIEILRAKLEALKDERFNLEAGLRNWVDEEAIK